MNTTWIVSADKGRARIFAETEPGQPLQEIEDMVNETARMRVSEIYTDKVGPTAAESSIHNTGGALPNKQYEQQTTPEELEAQRFAKDICARLQKAHEEGRFKRLALVAEPKFLGVLRMQLDPQLKSLVQLEINKDFSHSNAQQLRDQIIAHNAKS